MPDIKIGGLKLERGIDSVTHVGVEHAGSRLPDGYLTSTGGSASAPLVDVLSAQDTAQYLNAYLQPTVANRDLLSPAKFRAVLEEAQAGLSAAAEQGFHVRVLNRAIRLLNEDKGLRELLQMYRSALYPG